MMEVLLAGTGILAALFWGLAETLSLPWSSVRLPVYLVVLLLVAAWLLAIRKSVGYVFVLVTYFGAVWLATSATASPDALALLVVPTCVTTVIYGSRVGAMAVAATLAVLVWQIPPWQPALALSFFLIALLLLGAWSAVWATSRAAHDSARWAQESYEQMRSQLEAERDQRVELKQMRDDLAQANVELERLASRLTTMTRIAEEANRTKERFLANVSHELRTPLNMIIGFSEMITRSPDVYGVDLPSQLLADIAVIQRNSKHLAGLVDDILDLSRIEAEHLALEREWTDMQDVITDAISFVEPLFRSRGLFLRFDAETDLPRVYCDPRRIRQVVLNLLSNAGRFTARGGVTVRLWEEGGFLVCSVADTGRGISPRDRERIFEPFTQVADRFLQREEGTGLGLSISRSIIKLHKGSMWLESELGMGTTFFFRLPVTHRDSASDQTLARWFAAPEEAYQPRDRPSSAPHPRPAPRIIVLEQGQALARTLRRHAGDVDILGLRTMEDALAELNRAPAEALIVNDDVVERAIAGLGTLKRLPFGTPALVCWMPGDEEVAAMLGAKRYLVKPVDTKALLDCLEMLGTGAKTILIVDDDIEAVRLLARMILSTRRPYQVLRALTAQRALELMRQRRPDLVLLDMYLPGMSGFDLLRIKAQDEAIADIAVVAVSAHDPTASLDRGASIALVRPAPVHVQELLAAVQLLRGPTVREGEPDAPAPSGTSRE